MKPFDTKGEYSPEEVKDALAGVNGTRQLSFRYDRLDRNNKFIESLDYVQSCSISNNALADIKRTAKFNVLDTGTINYLQDRIKPYVRIAMPKPTLYSSLVNSYDPGAWYRFDDPAQSELSGNWEAIAANMTHNTYATAYVAKEGYKVYPAIGASGSTTVRPTLWVKLDITASNPINFTAYVDTPGAYTVEAYIQTGTTEAELTPVPGQSSGIFSLYASYPEHATYYIKFSGLAQAGTAAIEWDRPSRISDSSGNSRHMATANSSVRQPALLKDGGYSIERGDYLFGGKIDTPVTTKFSGMGWIDNVSGVTELAFAAYGNFNNEVNSAERSARRANIEIRIFYTERRIRIYGGFKNYATETYWDVYIPAGVDMKAWKNVAWAVDFENLKARLWMDGAELSYIPASPVTYGDRMATDALINYIDISSNGGTLYLDDTFFLFDSLLGSYDVQQLYTKGRTELDNRSGYVEWPQGVFVLSSPSRSLSEGGNISRDVEGYDQLVVLKEDSFPYRYSVSAGTKYTEAVKKIVQTGSPTRKITIYDGWGYYGSAVTYSADSVTLTTTSDTQVYMRTHQHYQLVGLNVSAKVQTPSSGGNLTSIMLEVLDGDTLTKLVLSREGANLNGYIAVNSTVNNIHFPYNATTMAFWRIREDAGYVHMEYSADRSTWTIHRSIKNNFSASAKARIVFYADHDAAVAGSVMSLIDVRVANTMETSVTDSSAVLVTPMEWEPGTSKLSIINDLLGAINYGSASYDEDGVFVASPYISPYDKASGFTYATDSSSVITNGVDQTMDLFGVPNKWVLVVSDPERPWLSAEYTNDNPMSPTSTVARGRTIVDYRTEQNAPDALTLELKAERLAFEASQVYEVIEFDTAIMPIHQNADVYNLIIDDLAVNSKYSETEWSMELQNGGTMKHKIRKIVGV